ncbi:MAG: O-antigen ligase family protein [Acidimicrobiales bacterium]|jgi:hypothetical protein
MITSFRTRSASRIVPVLVVAAFVTPFEFDGLLVRVAGVSFRLVQLLTVALVATAFFAAPPRWLKSVPRFAVIVTLTYVGGVCFSWWAASDFPASVRTTAVRLLLGPVLAVAVICLMSRLPRTSADSERVLRGLVYGAVLAALVGLLAWSNGGEWGPTTAFRGLPTSLGPYARLTRPFSHANIAAMYLTPVTAVALTLAVRRRSSRSIGRGANWAWWILPATLTTASLATYSRMVPVALAVGMGCAAWAGAPRHRVRWAVPAAGALAVLVLFAAASPAWSARLGSPGRQAWFATDLAVEAVPAGESDMQFDIVVSNRSTQFWTATGTDRVVLSLRWRNADNSLQFTEEQIALPVGLAPGESLSLSYLSSTLGRLSADSYVVLIDVLRDREAYFQETLGGLTTITVVGGDRSHGLSGRPVRLPVPEVGRLDLWRAATEIARDNPLSGVGPGNFRLLYGPYLGLDRFPSGSHGHSLIFESLASTGPLVMLSIVGMIGGVITDAVRRRRRRQLTTAEVSVFAAVMVMAVQGLVDWPLIFSSTSALFWLLLGLWVHLSSLGSGEVDVS